MKTIHKLVLKSYLGPMFLTFFIVMFVLMMNIVWRSSTSWWAKDSAQASSSS